MINWVRQQRNQTTRLNFYTPAALKAVTGQLHAPPRLLPHPCPITIAPLPLYHTPISSTLAWYRYQSLTRLNKALYQSTPPDGNVGHGLRVQGWQARLRSTEAVVGQPYAGVRALARGESGIVPAVACRHGGVARARGEGVVVRVWL